MNCVANCSVRNIIWAEKMIARPVLRAVRYAISITYLTARYLWGMPFFYQYRIPDGIPAQYLTVANDK